MNEDKIIENIIKKSKMKIAISEYAKEEKAMSKWNKISKAVATVAITLGIGTGLVYATGTAVYEKIWKQPESYKITSEVTDEEKSKCISEEEAEKIGNEYLEKIGFDKDTIRQLELKKELLEDRNLWFVNSEKVSMKINARTGKIELVHIPTWEYQLPYNYGITREEAIITAEELLEKYKPEDYEGEYKLVRLTGNMETDEASYIWYADFYRTYGDLINESEKISIGWIPKINALYSLSFKNITYENNDEKISKEEAIRVATEKDKQIEKNKTIIETKAEIRIKQMNSAVYMRENYKEDYEKGMLNYFEKNEEDMYKIKDEAIMYKTEERVRKVWCVVIEYSDEKAFTYYIDCTTREIIGGSNFDVLASEDNL